MKHFWRYFLATVVFGAGALFLPGCGGQDFTFSVFVAFPDQASLDQARWLRLFAIQPATSLDDCDDLISGTAVPGADDFNIEDQVSDNPAEPKSALSLAGIGPGRRLFFADVQDGNGTVYLIGCTELAAGSEGTREISIHLSPI